MEKPEFDIVIARPMTFQTEFPDFDASTMPAIPNGFVDVSWHNDACPSFQNEAAKLTLYVDYANPAEREMSETPRFTLRAIGDDISEDKDIVSTDDWSEIQSHILAIAFAENIKTDLSAEELAEVKRRNATYGAGICATHDFRDANMNMQAAYVATFGADPLDDMDAATPIWNRAWSVAKAEYLTER